MMIYTDHLTSFMLWLYIFTDTVKLSKIICVMYVMVIKRCTHPRLDTGASAPLQSFGAGMLPSGNIGLYIWVPN